MASLWDVGESLASGSLVHLLPEWRQPANVWAATTSRLGSSAKVRVCVGFLKQQFASGPLALARPRTGQAPR
jgi:LysR family transcriptional activator of dmlA